MRTSFNLLAVALIAGGTMFAQPRVSIGIGFGGYGHGVYAPPVYAQQYVPACPGPDYVWVDGYYAQQGWIDGFWRAPYVTGYGYGYSAGYRMAPRYVEPRYYNSYRSYDRDDRNRDHDRNRGYDNRNQYRGYDNRYQNRGNERHDDRGNGFRR